MNSIKYKLVNILSKITFGLNKDQNQFLFNINKESKENVSPTDSWINAIHSTCYDSRTHSYIILLHNSAILTY